MSNNNRRGGPDRVTSLFATWSSDFTAQVLLALVGVMLLGAVLWSIFIEPPASEPDAWSGWRTWDVVLIFTAWLSLSALGRLAWELLLHELHARAGIVVQRLTRNLGLVAAQVLAMIVAVWAFGLWQHGLRWSVGLNLKPLYGLWLWVALAVGFFVGPLPGIVAVIVMRRTGQRLTSDQIEFLVPDATPAEADRKSGKRLLMVGLSYPSGALAMIVLAGLAVPFGEEALFRGVLHSWLRGDGSTMNTVWAVFLSSLAFGVAHYRWDRVVVTVTFFFGIFLALIYDASGSLWAPILIHAMVNFPKIALVYLDRSGWFDWLSPAPLASPDPKT